MRRVLAVPQVKVISGRFDPNLPDLVIRPSAAIPTVLGHSHMGRFAFRTCILDTEARRFFRDGKEVVLRRKLFDLLETLLRSAPRALSSNELIERVWPDVHVSTGALNHLISELRQAIGDTHRTLRMIQTLPRFGYRFDEPVRLVTSAPSGSVLRIAGERRLRKPKSHHSSATS